MPSSCVGVMVIPGRRQDSPRDPALVRIRSNTGAVPVPAGREIREGRWGDMSWSLYSTPSPGRDTMWPSVEEYWWGEQASLPPRGPRWTQPPAHPHCLLPSPPSRCIASQDFVSIPPQRWREARIDWVRFGDIGPGTRQLTAKQRGD